MHWMCCHALQWNHMANVSDYHSGTPTITKSIETSFSNKLGGWKMTRHRFRILEFRGFFVFGISGKVTERQNASTMFPGGPSCLQTYPRWSKVSPQIKLNLWNLGKWSVKPWSRGIYKDAHQQTIEIGLVEIFSTWMVWHLETKRIPW